MLLTEIRRETPQVSQILGDYTEFASEARRKLGYRFLEQQLRKPLADVLAKLKIETLSKEDIVKYQDEMVLQLVKKIKPPTRWDYFSKWRFRHEPNLVAFRGYGGESGGVTSIFWCATNLSLYNKPIPEFVLNYALQIKEHADERVEFRVEELTVTNIPHRSLDPFLIVVSHKESYYIAVWNEPKFEGRITK